MKRIGWRHFEMVVPEDWDIVADGVSRDSEFFRLADSASIRLEVVLEKVPFEKAKSLDEMLDSYKKEWEKRVKELRKKQKVELEVKHASKEEIEVGGHKGVLWAFRVGAVPMFAAIWYCEKSERAVSMTFTSRGTEGEAALFKEIVTSAKCHYSSPKEKALWSLLLFDIRLPQSYQLVAARFTTFSSYAVFAELERREYVVIGYSGLVKAVLRRFKRGMKEWFEKSVIKEAKKAMREPTPRIRFENIDKDRLRFRGETFSIIKSRKRVFRGEVWHDKRIDRLVGVAAYYSIIREEEISALLNELISQLKVAKLSA